MTSHRQTLSVALATYNEAENIGRCLQHVEEWADEIVIVDGGSTDDTVKIAKRHTVRIIRANNPPMFHINKQRAIDACFSNWILQLDADEVVPKELKKEIQQVINSPHFAEASRGTQPINGYWIPRRNFFLGTFLNKGGQYPDYTLRLYRRGKGKLPCKSVHEQAIVDGETKHLHHALLHYPYPDFSHYLEHFNRYTDIFAQELREAKTPINIHSTLSHCMLKPKLWFLKTYIRHKGFADGFPGFVFSLFSALRFPVAYIKYWEKTLVSQKSKIKS